ncbi:MAG: polyribonucleotide nucleotidyltransferase [Parcubacteria group bacterium Gr01-1014_66]|nr:MAG: polyribonucleotide nucleotidyltransferase [Parcubacteria group bacterium Gr01-1014_66]
MESQKYSQTIAGKDFSVELTNWAEQANGSVLVRLGDTTVLATAVMNKIPREGGDFFPLMVDYEEKYYATGKILGSRFIKRETRPSEEAVLAGRLIDRSIRPRFNLRMRNEVQVILTILSVDGENDPDVPSLLAASLALSLSDIPWDGPIASVRVALSGDNKILNPLYTERADAKLDVIFSGTKDHINMIEAGAGEVTEREFAGAIFWAHNALKELITFQEHIISEHKVEKADVPVAAPHKSLRDLFAKEFSARVENAVYQRDKQQAHAATALLQKEWLAQAQEQYPEQFNKGAAEMLFDEAVNDIVHRRIIEKDERPDGRKPDELRPLHAATTLLPRVHGSGLFMRGETHVLSMLTLGSPGDQQIIEGMEIRAKRRFLHHYNFPPFSVGEIKPMRGPGRREIGHGALAGRALLPLIPSSDEFPYTIRIVSEVLSSNGSSSMASVCGSSIALMDAGVPIKKHAAGAAMGLMMNEKGDYKVLTDIQGPEDHHGDMDFKVAGTRDGITAVQMDVKIQGITHKILQDALIAAHRTRMTILDVMEKVIPEARAELSPWAPRIMVLKINPEKIGALIGPGGKVINEIIAKTGVQIDIEDDGTVFVTSENVEGMNVALSLIKQITREIKPGELLEGKVTRLFEFGAMVEIGPRQEGLIHISELAPWRVERVGDIVNQGDSVTVKVKNIDEQGRINLSLKDVPGRYDTHAHKKPPARDSSRPSGPRHDHHQKPRHRESRS